MSSTYTSNKNLEEPGSGDYVNTWNVPVNANFTAIDSAFGGVTNISVTSVTGPTVTLTTTQYTPPNIQFTGTLSASLLYQIPTGVGGIWSISNTTTQGSFTISFGINAGNSINLPQGRTLIISNQANVAFAAASNPVSTTENVNCYVLLFDGSNLVYSPNLTYNPSTGILTAPIVNV